MISYHNTCLVVPTQKQNFSSTSLYNAQGSRLSKLRISERCDFQSYHNTCLGSERLLEFNSFFFLTMLLDLIHRYSKPSYKK